MLRNKGIPQSSQSEILLVSILYFLSAWLSLKFTGEGGTIASVWLANGVLLAYLLTTPRSHWRMLVAGCMLANVLANLGAGNDMAKALALSACNMAEVAIPAHVLGGRLRNRSTIINWAFAQKFLIYAVVLGPAFAGALAGVALSTLQTENSGEIFKTWLMADALGIALVTPLAVALRRSGISAMKDKEGLAYMVLCLGLVGVVTAAVFSQSRYPLLFVIMPFLVFAAFRLGLAGLSAAYVICGSIALAMTSSGSGPMFLIAETTAGDRLFLVQMFILFIEVSTIPVALALESRLRLESQLATANARLEHLAGTDPLTGLPNRRAFDRAFEREWAIAARAKVPLAVAIVDVDHFKAFNDTYGHVAGDDCLTRLGEILSNTIFRPGDFIGRYGGEEFVIVLPGTDMAGAEKVCERVKEIVSAANLPHETSPLDHVTVSVGFASMTPDTLLSKNQLLEAADVALYSAKSNGRNRVARAAIGQAPIIKSLTTSPILVPVLQTTH
ncbi:GGDEF domain-containing protein [Taklimakanibacter lacteus]|uniref:GGDEF domain-containing protein n=1 Tax=Taklimakanibacter lacteus TaxID=2268456 RepID=UPI000E65ECF6